jgi:hypothetical protein
MPPQCQQSPPKDRQSIEVPGNRVVVEVALHYRFEPSAPFVSPDRACARGALASVFESLARMRLPIVLPRTVNRPNLFFPLICWKPRKSNVSGFPSPRGSQFSSANLANSIRRVLSRCSSGPNLANRGDFLPPFLPVSVLNDQFDFPSCHPPKSSHGLSGTPRSSRLPALQEAT